jgi:hypothetical protein
MKKNVFPLALLMASFSITSCKEEVKDVIKPTINLHEPADNDTLYVGHEVHLDVELSDDVKLKSYKIDIHSNFDGHTHASVKSVESSKAWVFSKVWDLTGLRNTDIHHHEIIVPDSIDGSPIAKGKYHFSIQVLDEAGNESKKFLDVVVDNGTPHED